MSKKIMFEYMYMSCFILGIVMLIFSYIRREKSNNFFYLKYIGIINIFISIFCIFISNISGDAFINILFLLITSFLIITDFIYIIVEILKTCFKYKINYNSKKLINIIVILLIFLGGLNIIPGIFTRKLENTIKLGDEFLLYEGNDNKYGNKKVYMTINDIDDDSVKTGYTYLINFDLRYDGDNPIPMRQGDINFNELCKFSVKVSPWRFKLRSDIPEGFELIVEAFDGGYYSSFVKDTERFIKPGEKILNVSLPLLPMTVDDESAESVYYEIETNHSDDNIKEIFKLD